MCFQPEISGCVGGYAQGYDGDDEKAVIEAMNKAVGVLNRSRERINTAAFSNNKYFIVSVSLSGLQASY